MVIDLNKIKTENDRTLKDKLKDGLEVAKEKGGDMVDWVKENPREFAAIVASAAALTAGAGKVIKGINRHATAKQEQYNKERYIYDHSLNAYLKTKRPLTKDDVIMINNIRRVTKKKLSEVLADLDLLE